MAARKCQQGMAHTLPKCYTLPRPEPAQQGPGAAAARRPCPLSYSNPKGGSSCPPPPPVFALTLWGPGRAASSTRRRFFRGRKILRGQRCKKQRLFTPRAGRGRIPQAQAADAYRAAAAGQIRAGSPGDLPRWIPPGRPGRAQDGRSRLPAPRIPAAHQAAAAAAAIEAVKHQRKENQNFVQLSPVLLDLSRIPAAFEGRGRPPGEAIGAQASPAPKYPRGGNLGAGRMK